MVCCRLTELFNSGYDATGLSEKAKSWVQNGGGIRDLGFGQGDHAGT